MNKLFEALKFLANYGDEAFAILTILTLIPKTMKSIKSGQEPNVAEVSRAVYRRLPSDWKTTAKEPEFIDTIYLAVKFYLAIQALFKK